MSRCAVLKMEQARAWGERARSEAGRFAVERRVAELEALYRILARPGS